MSIIVNDVMAVEDGEHADQQSAVPVISDTPPIVALSSQVGEGFERQLIIVIQEHLWSRHSEVYSRGGGEGRSKKGRGGKGREERGEERGEERRRGEGRGGRRGKEMGGEGGHTCICLILILKSDSLNSYGMFHPRAPNLRLSCTRAWKKQSPKRSFCHILGCNGDRDEWIHCTSCMHTQS